MHRALRSKLLISRKSVNLFLHIHVQRECSAEQTLYAQHPVPLRTSLPGSRLRFYIRDANSVLFRPHLCTAVLVGSMRRTLCSKLFIGRALRSIYTSYIQREYSAEPSMRRILCQYFPPLPVSRLHFFIAMQFHYSYERTLAQQ